MAPTIGRVALDNGFHGSIPGDWVAPPPQNIHRGYRKPEKGKKHYPAPENERVQPDRLLGLTLS